MWLAEQETQRAAAGQRLAEQRAALARKLPDAVWAALGMQPLAAEADIYTGEVTQSVSLAVLDGALRLRVVASASMPGPGRVSFHYQTRMYGEQGLGAVRLDGLPEANAQQVARLLAQATAEAASTAEKERRANVRELARWIEATRERTVEELQGKLVELVGLAWVTPEERAELVATATQAITAVRARVAAAAEREQRRAAIDAEVRALARGHVAEWAAYEAACQAWAEAETKRLWRSWGAWRVRYAPDVCTWTNGDADGDQEDLLQTVLAQPAWLSEQPFADDGAQQHFWSGMLLTVIERDGALTRRIIGAFLDAEPVLWEAPELHECLDYHRSQVAWVSGWTVNLPPLVKGVLALRPVEPLAWSKRLAAVDFGDEWRWQQETMDTEPAELAAAE